MKREKICRVLFVSAAGLCSLPWLTPCVGIWSAAAVDGVHNSITKRDEPLTHLPTKQLKHWAARPGPTLTIIENQFISPDLRVSDDRFGHRKNAPHPGTLVGKGASAIVDGITETLIWVDPFTWVSQNSMGMSATRPLRQLVICESPFVMLEGQDICYYRHGKSLQIADAKVTNGTVTVITPEGRFSGRAGCIHYRGPSNQVLLEQPYGISSDKQRFYPAKMKSGVLMKLDFVKRIVTCNGPVTSQLF